MSKYSLPFMVLIVVPILGCGTTSSKQSANTAPGSYITETQEKEIMTVSNDESAAGWIVTDSGLKYRITREGTGKKPVRSDTVEVHYEGHLDNADGKIFDSSYQRGEKISFPLKGVIAGWTEGLTYVKEGGEIELIIPSELGYGARGSGSAIPPHSTLFFKVELFAIK